MTLRELAIQLAQENRDTDEGFEEALLLPSKDEVRLIVVSNVVPEEKDGKVHFFYFKSDPNRGLPFPSAVALIRPEEKEKAALPDGWGTWREAESLMRANGVA